MGPIVNQEWLNQNSMRRYPLSEEASVRDTTDSFSIPDDLFVDMVWPVHATLSTDPSLFHVLQLAVFGTGINVTFAYNGTIAATVSVPLVGFARNSTYFMQGVGDFVDMTGKVTIGSLAAVLALAGVYEFSAAAGRIEASVIVPDIRGLSGIRVKTGETYGAAIQGDVAFESGENVRLDVATVGGVTVLTINAIDGEGTIADCECDKSVADRPAIKTINGVQPDAAGNIELVGDDCLEVAPAPGDAPTGLQAHTIALSDVCSKPCCGCSELETLVDDQQRVRDEVYTLTNVAARLEAEMSAMATIIAASS